MCAVAAGVLVVTLSRGENPSVTLDLNIVDITIEYRITRENGTFIILGTYSCNRIEDKKAQKWISVLNEHRFV
jgi:hypothetical protein